MMISNLWLEIQVVSIPSINNITTIRSNQILIRTDLSVPEPPKINNELPCLISKSIPFYTECRPSDLYND